MNLAALLPEAEGATLVKKKQQPGAVRPACRRVGLPSTMVRPPQQADGSAREIHAKRSSNRVCVVSALTFDVGGAVGCAVGMVAKNG